MKIALFLIFLTTSLKAEVFDFTQENNSVDWEAVGTPDFLYVDGEGGFATGTLTVIKGVLNGELTVSLKNYSTGSTARDHYFQTHLEIEKFPEAKLAIKDQLYMEDKETYINAEFTLKGTTKPIRVKYKAITLDPLERSAMINNKVGGTQFSARFTFDVTDYPGLGVKSLLGAKLVNDVTVWVDGEL